MRTQERRSTAATTSPVSGRGGITPQTNSTPRVDRVIHAATPITRVCHDLQTPVAAIAELVQSVAAGTIGRVSQAQSDCLRDAIRRCDELQALISELSQPSPRVNPLPPVCRRVHTIGWILQSVQQLYPVAALPAGVELLWDVAPVAAQSTLADAELIRRMLVNLINNAVAASSGGARPKTAKAGEPLCVLIRVQAIRGGETFRWSVIDRGCGLTPEQLTRIAAGMTAADIHPLHHRDADQVGAGIGVSRDLAGLHFSPLEIHSNVDFGTEVSFETPGAAPHAIASAWSRWRLAAEAKSVFATASGAVRRPSGAAIDPQSFARYDAAQSLPESPLMRHDGIASAHCVQLRFSDVAPVSADQLIAGTVTMGAAVASSAADHFDRLFQNEAGPFDLVQRIHLRRWAWVFDTTIHDIRDRLTRISTEATRTIPGLRLSWSDPQVIPVEPRLLVARVSDLLVRETLLANSHEGLDLARDEVRIGTQPILRSEVAAQRLEEELVRMSQRVATQTGAIRHHARRMRPDAT